MPRYQIASLDDPRLAPFRDLKRSNATLWTDTFVAEGMKLVDRLFDARYEIVSLLLGQSYADRYADRVDPAADLLIVPDEWIHEIVGFNFHRGILATARRPRPLALADVAARGDPLRLIVCPDVQNPENLGAILRLAAAFGVAGVVIGPESCDPYSRRVLRVSMGAAFTVALIQAGDVLAALRSLQAEYDIQTWATVLDTGAERLAGAKVPDRLALVVGSEGHGLTPEVIQACQRRVTIPMSPGVDSLNVAVAAGIFLYETSRHG
jgi:tRNA G18 (ribose-2'-O)-methylase SpoU